MSDDPESNPSPLDDMPAFMASTRRGVYMARELMARRPSREQLGEELQLFVQLVQASIEVGRMQGTVDDMQVRPGDDDESEGRYFWEPWMPLASSPCRAELEALEGAGWSHDLLHNDSADDLGRPLSLARQLINSAIDHMIGVALLLQHESTIRSPLALSRVALEAASRAWFLLDSELTAVQRFGRSWNIELDAMAKEVAALRKKMQLDSDPDADESLREIGRDLRTKVDDLVRLGLARSKVNKGRIEPYVGNATDIIDMVLDRADGWTYHELSKVVHSQDDGGLLFWFRDGEDGLRHPQRDRLIALNLAPAVIALLEAIRRLASYTRWDFSDAFALEPQVVGNWAVGSGLRDADLEASIIAEGWLPPEDATPEFWRLLMQETNEQEDPD